MEYNSVVIIIITLVGMAIGVGGGILLSNRAVLHRVENIEQKLDNYSNQIVKIVGMERDISDLDEYDDIQDDKIDEKTDKVT